MTRPPQASFEPTPTWRFHLEVALAIARRTLEAVVQRPVLLTFSLVQPLMWMGFFGFLFQRFHLDEAAGLSYIDFLAPGVCTMTVLFGATQSGIGWIRDLQTGFLPRILRTPASFHAVLLGKLLADGVRLLAQAMVVLALAWLLGVRFSPTVGSVGLGLVALGLFAVAMSCVSCTVALWARAPEPMAVFVHLINMPLLFTSTALVPIRQMPPWLAYVARWNPLSATADAWRQALLFGVAVPWIQLLPLAIAAMLFYCLAWQAMGRVTELD